MLNLLLELFKPNNHQIQYKTTREKIRATFSKCSGNSARTYEQRR